MTPLDGNSQFYLCIQDICEYIEIGLSSDDLKNHATTLLVISDMSMDGLMQRNRKLLDITDKEHELNFETIKEVSLKAQNHNSQIRKFTLPFQTARLDSKSITTSSSRHLWPEQWIGII